MNVKAVVAASIIAAFVTPAFAANFVLRGAGREDQEMHDYGVEADNVRDHRRERRYGLQDQVGGRIWHEDY